MKLTSNIKKNTLIVSALLASLSTSYGVGFVLDGYLTTMDSYTHKTAVYFYNGHEPEAYGTAANPTYQTYVHWGVGKIGGAGDDYFFMYVETPIEVKNMVWGSEVTPGDIAEYDVHFSNHHPKDPNKPNEDPTMDYGQATGSEFMAFYDKTGSQAFKSELKQLGGLSSIGYGMKEGRTSVDYLLFNGAIKDGANSTSTSLGRTVGMAFEYQFTKDDTVNNDLLDVVRDGGIIEYHLSPERGLVPTQVPEPSTSLLGIIGLMMILRRRMK